MAHQKIVSYQASVSLSTDVGRIIFKLVGGGTTDSGAMPAANVAAAIAVLQASKDAYFTPSVGASPAFVTNGPDAPGVS